MAMPDEIKVLSFTYAIERVKDLTEGADKCDGLCHPDEYWIKIDSGLRGHEKPRVVLLHEIVHVIEEHTGVTMKESQVDAFARALYSLMVDNPDLVAYLTEPKPIRKRKEPENADQTPVG